MSSLTATWIKGNGKFVPSELPLRTSDFSRLRPGPQGLVIPTAGTGELVRALWTSGWVKELDNTYWASEGTQHAER